MRDESTANILQASLELFVRDGYASTTIDRIAAAANMTKGGVYFYFAKKETILLRLIDDIKRAYFDDFYELNAVRGGTAQDRLVKLIHWQVTYAATHPNEIMLMILISIETNRMFTEACRRVASMYDVMEKFVMSCIEDGKRTREFPTALKTRELAAFFTCVHDGLMLEWYRRGRELDGRALVRIFRHSFLCALSGR